MMIGNLAAVNMVLYPVVGLTIMHTSSLVLFATVDEVLFPTGTSVNHTL